MRTSGFLLLLLLALTQSVVPVVAQPLAPGASPTLSMGDLPSMLRIVGDDGRPFERVRVEGVTVYSPIGLLSYAVTRSDPSAAISPDAVALTMRTVYHEDGYPLADVTWQADPSSGDLVIRVNEGHLGAVTIDGLSPRNAAQETRYFRELAGPGPIERSDLERALMLANDLAGVGVLSEFAVPDPRSRADLRLVGQQFRQAGSVTFDTVPIAVGTSFRTYVLQQANTLAFGGDTLRLMGFGMLEPDDASAAVGTAYYRVPVGGRGTYVEARGGNAFARREYRDLSLRSELQGASGAVGVGHPIRRDLGGYLYIIGEYEYLRGRSNFGEDQATESRSQSARATLVYGRTAANGAVVQLSATLTGGVSPGGDEVEGGDIGAFSHVRLGVGTLLPLGARTFQRIEIFAQPLAARLPVIEHLYLGHGPYLRGYPVVEFSGERGLKGTAELHHTLVARASGQWEIVPSVFVDFGYAQSRNVVTPYTVKAQGLASTGATVKLQSPGWFGVAAWIGVPLIDGPTTPSGKVRVGIEVTKGW